MTDERNILLVGCGNMGMALLNGWLAQGVAPRRIGVIDTQQSPLAAAAKLGVSASSALDPDILADVVVFAVKPQQLDEMLDEYRRLCEGDVTVLSIAAGKTLAYFESVLGKSTAIVRAMPNTPAAIGRGITAMVANAVATTAQCEVAESLLSAVGDVIWLPEEALMDAVTAVSGSGPAYVFLLIEALTAAAEREGLTSELARKLATATVAGAGAYAAQSDLEPAELRRRVTSPGGTTQAALEVLMAENGLSDLMAEAVAAATARSRELA